MEPCRHLRQLSSLFPILHNHHQFVLVLLPYQIINKNSVAHHGQDTIFWQEFLVRAPPPLLLTSHPIQYGPQHGSLFVRRLLTEYSIQCLCHTNMESNNTADQGAAWSSRRQGNLNTDGYLIPNLTFHLDSAPSRLR